MTPIALSELPAEPSILIRISREWRENLTDNQLYERVRRYWKVQPQSRKPEPRLAYGIAEGTIQAIYWIDRWVDYDMAAVSKVPDRADQAQHRPGMRKGFEGRPANEFAHLVGSPLIDPPAGQNPVTYLYC